MSVNKFQPHVIMIPEDDANLQLALGFLEYEHTSVRSIQVMGVAGGWRNVLERFKQDHAPAMDRFPKRWIVLLIDFDSNDGRREAARQEIPIHLQDRVFLLGVWTEPEHLRGALNTPYTSIGRRIAQDCHQGTSAIWEHDLLRHNAGEVQRMLLSVREIVFRAASSA